MTPSESLNMAYELIARASVCLNYTAGTTKPLLVAKLEAAMKSLEDTKKENTALALRIEELTKAAEDDRVVVNEKLKQSQKDAASLRLSVDTLQLDLQKATAKQEELLKEKNSALTERDNLIAEKSALEDQVCQQRELGFQQGIGKCHYYFQTPLDHPDFDIMKVYSNGELIDLSNQIASTPENIVPTSTLPNESPVETATDLTFKL